MERELVYKNLAVIKDAVMHHQEILVDTDDQNVLFVVSPSIWDEADHRRKDRSKFVISKTIAYCPSVFEEDQSLRDSIFAISDSFVEYFNRRDMGPLAELMHEHIMNEKAKDASHHDYPSEQTGT